MWSQEHNRRVLVNFEVTDYRGIGKSVARGFGTIKRQNTEHR